MIGAASLIVSEQALSELSARLGDAGPKPEQPKVPEPKADRPEADEPEPDEPEAEEGDS